MDHRAWQETVSIVGAGDGEWKACLIVSPESIPLWEPRRDGPKGDTDFHARDAETSRRNRKVATRNGMQKESTNVPARMRRRERRTRSDVAVERLTWRACVLRATFGWATKDVLEMDGNVVCQR